MDAPIRWDLNSRFTIVFPYTFPIDSLMSSLSDSSKLGLLVVPETIPNELNSIEGLNP